MRVLPTTYQGGMIRLEYSLTKLPVFFIAHFFFRDLPTLGSLQTCGFLFCRKVGVGNTGLSLDEKIGNSPPVYQLILNKKKTKEQTPATIANMG